MTRKGFTLVELLTVIIVLAILAGISVMKYIDLRNAALAAQVASDVHAVRVAAFNYFAEKEEWPAEAGAGGVPLGLGPLLPGQLAGSFDRTDYVLDYDNFGISATEVMIGVAVTTSDPRLMAKFIQTLGNKTPFFVSGGRLTYLIAGPGGIM
jgi:prepilin-type N-terminal cleavage/methylation domain-containing protein